MAKKAHRQKPAPTPKRNFVSFARCQLGIGTSSSKIRGATSLDETGPKENP